MHEDGFFGCRSTVLQYFGIYQATNLACYQRSHYEDTVATCYKPSTSSPNTKMVLQDVVYERHHIQSINSEARNNPCHHF